MDGGKNCSYQDGLMTHYVFENKPGVPMLHLDGNDHQSTCNLAK
ncbi:MAG: hypothetical protein V8S58_11815 [Lachnospiraceae bacterium]